MENNKQQSVYGEIPCNWRVYSLKDVCVEDNGILTGPFGSQLHQRDYQIDGVPIITVEHLGENYLIHSDIPRVSNSDYERLSRYKLEAGDIVFSRVGSVDRRALVRDNESGWLFSGRCLRVRPNRKIVSPEFLSWFFGLPIFQDYIRKIAVGATMPSLNTTLLSNIEVILPPLVEQNAIADILSKLTDLSLLNEETNRTLEATGEALFKRWFVDFEFPNQEGKPYKTTSGKMVYDETLKKEIPEGWKTGNFAQLAEIKKGDIVDGPFGSNLKSSDFTESGVRLIHQENIEEFKFVNTKKRFTSPEKADSLSRSLTYPGDVVITKMPEPITRAARIPEGLSERFIVMADCIRVRPHRESTPSEYIQYLINSTQFRLEAEGRATGTTRPRINLTQVKSIKVIIPPVMYRLKFSEIIRPLEAKRELNWIQNERLNELRDLLLPKLMSGKIRVPINKENLGAI